MRQVVNMTLLSISTKYLPSDRNGHSCHTLAAERHATLRRVAQKDVCLALTRTAYLQRLTHPLLNRCSSRRALPLEQEVAYRRKGGMGLQYQGGVWRKDGSSSNWVISCTISTALGLSVGSSLRQRSSSVRTPVGHSSGTLLMNCQASVRLRGLNSH